MSIFMTFIQKWAKKFQLCKKEERNKQITLKDEPDKSALYSSQLEDGLENVKFFMYKGKNPSDFSYICNHKFSGKSKSPQGLSLENCC